VKPLSSPSQKNFRISLWGGGLGGDVLLGCVGGGWLGRRGRWFLGGGHWCGWFLWGGVLGVLGGGGRGLSLSSDGEARGAWLVATKVWWEDQLKRKRGLLAPPSIERGGEMRRVNKLSMKSWLTQESPGDTARKTEKSLLVNGGAVRLGRDESKGEESLVWGLGYVYQPGTAKEKYEN